ncbi:MAG: hypothetical protein WBL19_02530 [Minisyncoccia bacterium]
MKKKVTFTLIVLLVLGLIGYLFLRDKDSNVSVGEPVVDEGGVPRQDPSNATFTIDGEAIKLTDGKNETSVAPGSSFVEETSILENRAYGDINADGKEDTVLFLVRYGAGSGTFVYLAAFVSGPVTYRGSNAIFLGDRISPESIAISGEIITAEYLDRKPDEPMASEPTIPVTKQFIYRNGELRER